MAGRHEGVVLVLQQPEDGDPLGEFARIGEAASGGYRCAPLPYLHKVGAIEFLEKLIVVAHVAEHRIELQVALLGAVLSLLALIGTLLFKPFGRHPCHIINGETYALLNEKCRQRIGGRSEAVVLLFHVLEEEKLIQKIFRKYDPCHGLSFGSEQMYRGHFRCMGLSRCKGDTSLCIAGMHDFQVFAFTLI
jgi:hypothetical protein